MSDKLKNISPILSELKDSKNGFKTPENYFYFLDDRMLTNIALEKFKKPEFKIPIDYFDKVEKEIHLKIIKENHFKVPLDYFENFEVKLDKSNINSESKVFTLNRFWIPAAIAAMFIITFGINYFQNTTPDLQMADLEYLIENGSVNINSYDLGELYASELDKIDLTDFIAQKEIEDYLGNDINEIIYYD